LGAGQAQDLPVQSLWFVGSAIWGDFSLKFVSLKFGLRQLCLLRRYFLPCGSPTTTFGDDGWVVFC